MKRLVLLLTILAACGGPARPAPPTARAQPAPPITKSQPAPTPASPASDASWAVLASGMWRDAERMIQLLAIVHIEADAVGSLGATVSVRSSQLAIARATLRASGFGAHLVEPAANATP